MVLVKYVRYILSILCTYFIVSVSIYVKKNGSVARKGDLKEFPVMLFLLNLTSELMKVGRLMCITTLERNIFLAFNGIIFDNYQ